MKAKLSLFFLLFFSLTLWSQEDGVPAKPNPPRAVNNFSKEFPDFFSSAEQEELEMKLEAFQQETSNAIVIVVIDDLNGYEPWDFATKIGDKWAVGGEKDDNGIILLIKPTGGKGDRKIHIAVGKGLEGAIPDITADNIVEQEILPRFKEGDFYGGVNQGLAVVMKLAKGEINQKDYNKKNKGKKLWPILIIVIIVILVMKFGPKGRGGGGGFTYFGAGAFGGFGGGSSGGSSGGFGGFGGGSFGGGGAGGSW